MIYVAGVCAVRMPLAKVIEPLVPPMVSFAVVTARGNGTYFHLRLAMMLTARTKTA